MNKLLVMLFLFFLITGGALYSEETPSNPDTTSQTRIKKGVKIGGYGALSMRFSALDGNDGFATGNSEFAYLIGSKGGITINNWTIGVGFYVLANSVPFRCGTDEDFEYCDRFDNKLILGYGGAYFSYLFNIKNYFGVETGILIGGGSLKGKNEGEYEWDGTEYSPSRSFFVLEPEVLLVGKVTGYLAFGLGVSYRMITGFGSESAYDTGDLSGIAGTFDVRLGVF